MTLSDRGGNHTETSHTSQSSDTQETESYRNDSRRTTSSSPPFKMSSSRSSIRSDASKLPPCLRLLHERRKSNLMSSTGSTTSSDGSNTNSSQTSFSKYRKMATECDDLLPPAFRICLSKQAARQSILRDVTAASATSSPTGLSPNGSSTTTSSSPVRRIQRNLSLKRATWRKFAQHGRKNKLTSEVLKLVALRATNESAGASDVPPPPLSSPPSPYSPQLAAGTTLRKGDAGGLITPREAWRIMRQGAATSIQTCYRRHTCRRTYLRRLQRLEWLREKEVLLKKKPATTSPRSPRRPGFERSTSELTMSEFGDSLHHTYSMHSNTDFLSALDEDTSHYSRRRYSSDSGSCLCEVDSFESLGDLCDSPKTSMNKRGSLASRNTYPTERLSSSSFDSMLFHETTLAVQTSGGSVERQEQNGTSKKTASIRQLAATGSCSFSSYFGKLSNEADLWTLDSPMERPQRQLSPKGKFSLQRVEKILPSLPFRGSGETSEDRDALDLDHPSQHILRWQGDISPSPVATAFASGWNSANSFFPAVPPTRKVSPSYTTSSNTDEEELKTPIRATNRTRIAAVPLAADSPKQPLRKESSHGGSPVRVPPRPRLPPGVSPPFATATGSMSAPRGHAPPREQNSFTERRSNVGTSLRKEMQGTLNSETTDCKQNFTRSSNESGHTEKEWLAESPVTAPKPGLAASRLSGTSQAHPSSASPLIQDSPVMPRRRLSRSSIASHNFAEERRPSQPRDADILSPPQRKRSGINEDSDVEAEFAEETAVPPPPPMQEKEDDTTEEGSDISSLTSMSSMTLGSPWMQRRLKKSIKQQQGTYHASGVIQHDFKEFSFASSTSPRLYEKSVIGENETSLKVPTRKASKTLSSTGVDLLARDVATTTTTPKRNSAGKWKTLLARTESLSATATATIPAEPLKAVLAPKSTCDDDDAGEFSSPRSVVDMLAARAESVQAQRMQELLQQGGTSSGSQS